MCHVLVNRGQSCPELLTCRITSLACLWLSNRAGEGGGEQLAQCGHTEQNGPHYKGPGHRAHTLHVTRSQLYYSVVPTSQEYSLLNAHEALYKTMKYKRKQ